MAQVRIENFKMSHRQTLTPRVDFQITRSHDKLNN